MSFPAARIRDLTMHGGMITLGTPTTLIANMPASRLGDLHTCPMVTVLVPHVGGPIILGAFNVLVGGPPQARVLDPCVCVGPPAMVVLGEFTVLVGMAGAFSGGIGGFLSLLVGGFTAGLQSLLGQYPRAVACPVDADNPAGYYTQYSPRIRIQGSPEYQAQVIADLNSPRNRAVVDAINNGNHNVTIRPVPAGEDQANGGATRVNPADGLLRPDGSRGPGTDTIIDYNPSYSQTYRGEDGNLYTQPPEDVLGHELIHSMHNDRGENRRDIPDTMPGGDNQEEARTIGVHGYEGEPISERQMSEAAGRSPRPNHDAVESGTYQDTDGQWYRADYDGSGNRVNTPIPPPSDRPNH